MCTTPTCTMRSRGNSRRHLPIQGLETGRWRNLRCSRGLDSSSRRVSRSTWPINVTTRSTTSGMLVPTCLPRRLVHGKAVCERNSFVRCARLEALISGYPCRTTAVNVLFLRPALLPRVPDLSLAMTNSVRPAGVVSDSGVPKGFEAANALVHHVVCRWVRHKGQCLLFLLIGIFGKFLSRKRTESDRGDSGNIYWPYKREVHVRRELAVLIVVIVLMAKPHSLGGQKHLRAGARRSTERGAGLEITTDYMTTYHTSESVSLW